MVVSRWLQNRIKPYVDYHQHRYARALASVLGPESRWLDLGAGSRIHGGWLSPTPQELADQAGCLIGCDVQAEHLRLHPMLDSAVVSVGEFLPFRSDSFDVVSSNMVLEHLADPFHVITEIRRVLKPGGAFVFVTPNRSHPVIWTLALVLPPRARQLLARVVERHRAEDRIFLTHYLANTSGDVARLARTTALDVQSLGAFSSYPMFDRFPPLLAMEAAWIRLTAIRNGPFRHCGSNLLGVLRKPTGVVVV